MGNWKNGVDVDWDGKDFERKSLRGRKIDNSMGYGLYETYSRYWYGVSELYIWVLSLEERFRLDIFLGIISI